MAKKQVMSEHAKEIRKAMSDKKAIFGLDRTLKMLKQGKAAKVFIASNCADETKKDLVRYCSLANVPLVELKYGNDELGTLCKRQHFISVLSIGA